MKKEKEEKKKERKKRGGGGGRRRPTVYTFPIQKQQNVKTVDFFYGFFLGGVGYQTLTDLLLPADELNVVILSNGDNTGQALNGSQPSLTLLGYRHF